MDWAKFLWLDDLKVHFNRMTVIKHFVLTFRRTQDFIFMRILAKKYVMISVHVVLRKRDAEPCNSLKLTFIAPENWWLGDYFSFGKVISTDILILGKVSWQPLVQWLDTNHPIYVSMWQANSDIRHYDSLIDAELFRPDWIEILPSC